MMGNFVTLNKKEYAVMDITYLKLDDYVYVKEGSNNFSDLKKTLQSIVPKLAKINTKDNEVLVKTLTQFFIRNNGLGNIIGDGFFWFNQYPIVIADKSSFTKPDDANLECGYISCDSIDELDMYKKIINGAIEFGFNYYEHDLKFKFSINKVVNALVTLLVENEEICKYLFSFEVVELSKDKILVGENIVDVIEVPKLVEEVNGEISILNGLWSVNSTIRDSIENKPTQNTIKYEQYLSNLKKFNTITHELLHGIFHSYDIDVLEIVKKHGKNSKAIEEELVHRLAYFLTTTILDNEEFVINTLNTIVNFDTGTMDEIVERDNKLNEKYAIADMEKMKQQQREAEAALKLKEMKLEYDKRNEESRENIAKTIAATEELKKLLNAENE